MPTCDHAERYARASHALHLEQAKPKSRGNRLIMRAAGRSLVALEAERATCPICTKETR